MRPSIFTRHCSNMVPFMYTHSPVLLRQRAQVLLELATGLAPSLDDEGISLLYRAAKPLVRDDASRLLQKRAYKVMNCRFMG